MKYIFDGVKSVRVYSYVTNRAPLAGKDRSRVGVSPRYSAKMPKFDKHLERIYINFRVGPTFSSDDSKHGEPK